MISNVLTIAGSDPSGGAGIQADLKTFSALGVFGTSVITALTAQNTRAVSAVHDVPVEFIAAQLDTLLEDVDVAAVKIGMVGAAGVAQAIEAGLTRHRLGRVVLDPVMVARSGDRLVGDAAVAAVRDRLVPLATVITPNLHEAGTLLARDPPRSVDGMKEAARALHDLGARNVLVKGGALQGDASPDVLYDGTDLEVLEQPRVATANTHGTGCTLSSAIAALIPQRPDVASAVRDAKRYVTAALEHADELSVGAGHGPVHHFHRLWRHGATA